MRRVGLGALAIGLIACSEPEDPREPRAGSLIDDPAQEFPESFDDVGLYPRAPDWELVPYAAIGYEPKHPLWSNGSEKHRYVVLPEGERVDNRAAVFGYPIGTIFFKTFFYDDGDALRPVETRLLRLGVEDEWDYAVYLWEGHVAALVDNSEPVPAPQDAGFTHTIPAELDCRACHESAFSFVLGWDDLQLADAYGSLPVADLFEADPPADPPRVEDPNPRQERVLGDFYGNCVHCHNGTDGPSSSFDLRPDVALENMIDVETDGSATAAGIRVVPGDPASSILFLAISGETGDPEIKQMPPIGVDVRDADTIEILREWIEGL